MGGAIFLKNSSEITISDNIFDSCESDVGGAIKWNRNQPTFLNNKFIGNHARRGYGPDIASYSRRLKLISESELPIEYLNNRGLS